MTTEIKAKRIKNQPLKWHGGKSYLAKWIHGLAPPSVIADPTDGYTHRNIAYFGAGGEFWNWECEGISEAVNDINAALTCFWHVLCDDDDFEEFSHLVNATPFSQASYEDTFADSIRGPVEIALQVFVRYRQSRQGLGKDYATPTRRTRRGMNENVSAWLSAVEGLPECHERLKRVEIRTLDALEFIDKYDHERALLYLDPPYLHSTRSTGGGEYAFEMTDRDHGELLNKLALIDGKFMLSGYHSDIYDDYAALADWTCHEKEIDNKASSKKTKDKKTECVWTNY